MGSPTFDSAWERSRAKRKKDKLDDMMTDMERLMFDIFDPKSGDSNPQTTSSLTTAADTSSFGAKSGNPFGNLGTSMSQPKLAEGPFSSSIGGSTQGQNAQNMLSGLGLSGTNSAQQQGVAATTGAALFGASMATTSQAQSRGLFSTFGGNANVTQQTGTTGGGLFGSLGNPSTTSSQPKALFPSLGGSINSGGLFSGSQAPTQRQQQKPTLSLFGSQSVSAQQQPEQPTNITGAVVPGVKIDVTGLLPTTKFESCSDELKKQIEAIDTFILSQIHMAHEVADLLPTIANQGATIPNDVEFVQSKLDTMQHALENDARDIDHVRKLVSRDATEAQVAFRAIDNLKLPLQYQSTSGGWWSVPDQQIPERQSLRSTIGGRRRTLALPDDVEADPSTTTSINGIPVNLVDYFSRRSDEMRSILENYKGNFKEIEDHLHGVEFTLNRQINEFVASRSRDGTSGNAGMSKPHLNDLAAVLGDVEAGIFGVASRLGSVKEEVQELVLGPLSLGIRR